jgi:translation elongation factor EF-1alpha
MRGLLVTASIADIIYFVVSIEPKEFDKLLHGDDSGIYAKTTLNDFLYIAVTYSKKKLVVVVNKMDEVQYS